MRQDGQETRLAVEMKRPEELAPKETWIQYANIMEYHLRGADREIDRLANEVKDLKNPREHCNG